MFIPSSITLEKLHRGRKVQRNHELCFELLKCSLPHISKFKVYTYTFVSVCVCGIMACSQKYCLGKVNAYLIVGKIKIYIQLFSAHA